MTQLSASVIAAYFGDLGATHQRVACSDRHGRVLTLVDAVGKALQMLTAVAPGRSRLFFIGNGGSAAIASHMATDYGKNGGMPALAFNDGAGLTCLANDLGFEQVFALPIRQHARPGDLLVAISSSGRSPNILIGVTAARDIGCQIIGLSGFDQDNPLRGMGDLNFHVPDHRYGIVEIAHLSLVHLILDLTLAAAETKEDPK